MPDLAALTEDLATLVTPNTLVVLVVNVDDREPAGITAEVRARAGLTNQMFAGVLRAVANRYDPPIAFNLLSAEHLPDCDCARCRA